MPVLDVICPPGVAEGELISIETAEGVVTVPLPANVYEGDTFKLELTGEEEPEPPGGLAMIAAEMAGINAIVADFAGTAVAEVKGSDVLAQALRSILQTIEYTRTLGE